jgi:hypothetical protein
LPHSSPKNTSNTSPAKHKTTQCLREHATA